MIELQEAKRISGNLRKGEVINIGGDAKAKVGASGNKLRSFDMKVENTQTGETTRNIEVTSVENSVFKAEDLTEGITHAIKKRIDATSGTVEATIQIELASQGKRGKTTRLIDESGNYSDLEKDGSSHNTGNIFQDVKDNLPKIEIGNESKIKDNPNVNLIDRINLIRKDGSLFATYFKENGEWKLKM